MVLVTSRGSSESDPCRRIDCESVVYSMEISSTEYVQVSPTSQTGTSTMVADVCACVCVLFGVVYKVVAVAQIVVSSIRLINIPTSFVFIFFTPVLFSNVLWSYKDIFYIFLVFYIDDGIICSGSWVFVSQGTHSCLLFGPRLQTLSRTRRSPGCRRTEGRCSSRCSPVF